MRFRRSTRLPAFEYRGCYRYFVTICTDRRSRSFVAPERVALVRQQLFRTASEFQVAVVAYCFMPDHLHILTEGLAETADFRAFMHAFKQRSAFCWKRAHQTPLWERSYFEHVLRDEEDTPSVARYILANPVRAGLAASPADYPYSGSGVVGMEDLIESIREG